MDIRVGIDFGTFQTKVCLNYSKSGQLQTFEFVDFGSGEESVFFLPSIIHKTNDGRLAVGDLKESQKSFQYFKIAAAEDKQFRLISDVKNKKRHYSFDRYDGIAPEVLAALYLFHVIGKVHGYVESRHGNNVTVLKKGGILAKKRKEYQNESTSKTTEFNYYYNIGVPTEWSENRKKWRLKKFEQILYLAHEMIRIHSYPFLQDLPFDNLLILFEYHYDILRRQLQAYEKYNIPKTEWEKFSNRKKIQAYPEAAAGLNFLTKKQLEHGYHMALDIGGGSSDISFFRVTRNRRLEYLASESLLIAANDVYELYAQEHPQIDTTEKAQKHLSNLTEDEIHNDRIYLLAYKKVIEKLNYRIKQIYSGRVYNRFIQGDANQNFKQKDCHLYGGGALLPVPRDLKGNLMKIITLHDNVIQHEINDEHLTQATVRPIDTIDLGLNIIPNTWIKDASLLIVALGLALVQPDDTYLWEHKTYQPGEGVNYIGGDTEIFETKRSRWV